MQGDNWLCGWNPISLWVSACNYPYIRGECELNRLKETIVAHLLVICTMSLFWSVVTYGFTLDTGEIIGTVNRGGSGARINSAQVRLREMNRETKTDSVGEFRFENLPPGVYTLDVSTEEYGVKDGMTVTVTPGQVTEVELYLEPLPFMFPEVPVTAERLPATVSRKNLEVREIKRMPGAVGDALRALPSLPGIGVANDLDGSLHIRGGGPDDNIFYFDRLPIAYPYHFMGIVSTVSTEVIDGIDVYAGGFGAEFGADAQAVIDIHSRRGNRERLAGKFNINMLYSEGMVEGPIGERGAWYVAARRSYIDLLAPLFIDFDGWKPGEDEQVKFGENLALPQFWDYQARFSYDLNTQHQLVVNAFATSEFFNIEGMFEKSAEMEHYSHKVGFHAQGVHLRSRFTNRLTSYLTFSRSYDLARVAHGTTDESFFLFENTEPTYQLREDLTYRFNPGYQLETGVLLSTSYGRVSSFLSDPDEFDDDFLTQVRVDLDEDKLDELKMEKRLTNVDSYLQVRYNPTSFASAALGVRQSYSSFTEELSVGPRASLQFQVSDGLGIRLLYGRYSQDPRLLQILPEIGNPDLKSSNSSHYVLEVEREITSSTHLKLAGYYKNHHQIITRDNISNYLNQGEGFARGAEVLLRHREGDRLIGFLSYAYSRSLRRDQPESRLQFYDFDQTHVATLAGSYNLTPALEIGAKWRYSTGNPYTPTIGFTRREEKIQDPKYGEGTAISAIPVLGEVNSLRVPPYHRLDIRVKKTFIFNRWQMGVFLELMNVYNRKNIFDFSHPSIIPSSSEGYVGESEIEKEANHQLPFIPYLGITMDF